MKANGTRFMFGRLCAVAILATCVTGSALASDQWVKPTAEELSMTAVPGHPGAPAAYLLREEITKDDLHVVQHYERIKILTEKGKDYANVELRFASFTGDFGDYNNDNKTVSDIAGRTIHADGTVIPFSGKPYRKVIYKGPYFKYQARVFTLPDVEVGSIVEYRYATRIDDNIFEAPDWFIQGDIFTKAAHFVWYPTVRELGSSEGTVNSITMFPILPDGVKLEHRETPGAGQNEPQQIYELTAHDVAALPEEDFMPPMRSFTYRVLFAYSAYRSGPEFWKSTGKKWAKEMDKFIGPDNSLKAATETVVAGAQTQEDKLKKIYAAVMAMENTDFTRDHQSKEDKATGLGKISTAGDVFKHGRGYGNELAAVYVGMARAAGMKAYLMMVPDRSKRLFTPGWMSLNQFDNSIAIVNVDGKERFFDPGQRYCAFGHLAWEDTMVQGMRQVDGGSDFATTPGDNYTDTKTGRVANLTMDERGEVTGPVNLSFTGSAALDWRRQALRGDEESLKLALRTTLEGMLPKTLEVKVTSIENLTDYEKPLVANFTVAGSLGTPTGKRLILPVDLFLVDDAVTFPHDKREMPVYFPYPQTVQDALRIKFPATLTVEAAPPETKVKFHDAGLYSIVAATAPDSVTVRRSYLFNGVVVQVKDYGDLRTFYSQMETKDKDSIVLRVGAENKPGTVPAAN
ncbi:MAG: DUF3857 domain-containing protein [Acidobacteriaceae bacterium]